jgi:hypothetical protein
LVVSLFPTATLRMILRWCTIKMGQKSFTM